ncbi:hypothetical protein ACH4ZX_28570 [Streptomyces sp. NPDC020490]|uniref:hypothetical protein n=1 Tax=Streptomyces sp. NPDC020490 TaxID=3365078 RepID=UPI0037983431
MSDSLYAERSWNPLWRPVELTEDGLRRGGSVTPLAELNLGAMAEAFQRGHWLGGGGAERPLERLPEGTGFVPVTRVTGTATPVSVRQAARFARALGELAVRRCGGPEQVAALADRARAEGVPLWMARRSAPGPAGPVTVVVDRRLVRVDVWGPGAPVVRIRAPHGFHRDSAQPAKGLRMTVGEVTAQLSLNKKLRKSKSSVEVRLPEQPGRPGRPGQPGGRWTLRRENAVSSWLSRDDRRVALLTCPPRRPAHRPGELLRPLAPVRYESADPLDAVMAQVFSVAFGVGDATGLARFSSEQRDGGDEGWDLPWFSNLGNGSDDNESGAADGWGSDGDGGDGGSDGGGGDGGGD